MPVQDKSFALSKDIVGPKRWGLEAAILEAGGSTREGLDFYDYLVTDEQSAMEAGRVRVANIIDTLTLIVMLRT